MGKALTGAESLIAEDPCSVPRLPDGRINRRFDFVIIVDEFFERRSKGGTVVGGFPRAWSGMPRRGMGERNI